MPDKQEREGSCGAIYLNTLEDNLRELSQSLKNVEEAQKEKQKKVDFLVDNFFMADEFYKKVFSNFKKFYSKELAISNIFAGSINSFVSNDLISRIRMLATLDEVAQNNIGEIYEIMKEFKDLDISFFPVIPILNTKDFLDLVLCSLEIDSDAKKNFGKQIKQIMNSKPDSPYWVMYIHKSYNELKSFDLKDATMSTPQILEEKGFCDMDIYTALYKEKLFKEGSFKIDSVALASFSEKFKEYLGIHLLTTEDESVYKLWTIDKDDLEKEDRYLIKIFK